MWFGCEMLPTGAYASMLGAQLGAWQGCGIFRGWGLLEELDQFRWAFMHSSLHSLARSLVHFLLPDCRCHMTSPLAVMVPC